MVVSTECQLGVTRGMRVASGSIAFGWQLMFEAAFSALAPVYFFHEDPAVAFSEASSEVWC